MLTVSLTHSVPVADLGGGARGRAPPISRLRKIFYTAYFTCAEQIRIIYNVNQPAFIITCKPQIDRKSMLTCLAGKRCVVLSVSLLNKTHFKTLLLSKLIIAILHPPPPISEILDLPLVYAMAYLKNRLACNDCT